MVYWKDKIEDNVNPCPLSTKTLFIKWILPGTLSLDPAYLKGIQVSGILLEFILQNAGPLFPWKAQRSLSVILVC